ncbi:DUF6199 family natural product biosynthesis protein [Saccharibacillus alkalitolerans]|uniref:DUF6199 domain-containing protein n=1 Tax=Saccharibacillus alkalitolerans TaxID=2705290 RepID=A0ABX0F2B7_9BACL|nr:DUF6199 family natural product biosynthesis protein [Saccharibacillus alkalitolerans]NGZ73769.1 hypothetical protein [Saccharibacillus alkalitolerans]
MFLLFFVLVAIGAVNVLTPQLVWRMRYGRTAGGSSQPNSSFLALSRMAGMVFLLIATLLLLIDGL